MEENVKGSRYGALKGERRWRDAFRTAVRVKSLRRLNNNGATL